MKAYKFAVEVYASVLDYTHNSGETQQRIYMPTIGEIGYREGKSFDFFLSDASAMEDGELMLAGRVEGCELMGEFEVDQSSIAGLVAAAARARDERDEAQKRFSELGDGLVSILA
jgi:hypothetical protein